MTQPRPAAPSATAARPVTVRPGEAPDFAWTVMIIRRLVSTHKHLPRLTAAEWVMDAMPLESDRFALSRSEALDVVLELLD